MKKIILILVSLITLTACSEHGDTSSETYQIMTGLWKHLHLRHHHL